MRRSGDKCAVNGELSREKGHFVWISRLQPTFFFSPEIMLSPQKGKNRENVLLFFVSKPAEYIGNDKEYIKKRRVRSPHHFLLNVLKHPFRISYFFLLLHSHIILYALERTEMERRCNGILCSEQVLVGKNGRVPRLWLFVMCCAARCYL